MRISFYFDEDSMAHALLRALTARGVDVASALSEDMIQKVVAPGRRAKRARQTAWDSHLHPGRDAE